LVTFLYGTFPEEVPRVNPEQQRQQAEKRREVAEQKRAEARRQAAEGERHTAEGQRIIAEETRYTAQGLREEAAAQQRDSTHGRSASDDHPLRWSSLFVHSSAAGMPRAGVVALGTPSSTSLVVCFYPPERMQRALLKPYAGGLGLCGRGGKGQQATRLHDICEQHEQGLISTEDFPN
jgi:hypothetical protein